jgi:hypothetical protein
MEKRESQSKKKDAHVNRPRNHRHTQKTDGTAYIDEIRTEPGCTAQAKEIACSPRETALKVPLTGD